MEPGQSFLSLFRFVREKIDKYQLMDSDPSISRVHIDSQNLAQSYVYIEFQNKEELLIDLGVHEDDAWFAHAVDSPYDTFQFTDEYTGEDDFKEGYGIWYILDEDNTNLLEKISKFLLPLEFDLNDDSFKKKLAEKLIKHYPKEISSIISDYIYERNKEMNQAAQEGIDKEINNYLSQFSIELYNNDTLKIKIGDLISLYYQYDATHLPIKKMIKSVFKKDTSDLGGWNENRWEYANDEYFDSISVNREIYKIFDKIYDSLVEGFENDSDLKRFFEFIEKITKKFKLGVWFPLPKDQNFSFKIDEFDKDELKIVVSLLKPNGKEKKLLKVSMTEPNFNNLLYQPELFNLEDL